MAGRGGLGRVSRVGFNKSNSNLDYIKKTYQEAFEHVGYRLLEQRIKEQEKEGDDKQSYRSRYERFAISVATQDQLRTGVRGSSTCVVPREPWIQGILRRLTDIVENLPVKRNKHGFELAVYRTAHYEGSDYHWADVHGKFEAHLSTWGDGVEGSEEVKPLLKLHWFDAKEIGLGLNADAVDAAKRLGPPPRIIANKHNRLTFCLQALPRNP